MEPRPPRLVLVPGLLNDAELWRDQVRDLAGDATCVVADITKGQSLEELAEEVLGVGGPRFALAGFSFGGYVAQEAVRAAPGRIAGLALLDTSTKADTVEQLARRRRVAKAADEDGAFHGFGNRLLEVFLDESNQRNEVMIGRIRGMTTRLGPSVLVRQSSIERREGVDMLARLTCPFLIVCGENDRVTPLADHRAMLSHAPHGRLVVIGSSGHMTPIENPDAVTNALRSWLSDITNQDA